MYLFLLFTECDYSEQACKNVGAVMGRTFKRGSYATKGCYLYYYKRYGGNIYYGTGGSETKRNSNLPRSWTKKRPPGFDCNRGLVAFYMNPYRITYPL